MKKIRAICLITVIMLVVLTAGGLAYSRWYVLCDVPQTKISLDTFSFNSSLEDKGNYRLYMAKCWIKYETKQSDAVFKKILENLEFSCKVSPGRIGAEFEYRTLERYGYDWADKEIFHKKYESPEWKTPAPDSGLEMLLINIVNYDLDRREGK